MSVTEPFQSSEAIVTLHVTSNGNGPFYVVRLLVYLNNPAQSDLILDNINLDGIYSITFSQFYGSPQIVVIASGSTMGEVISSLPSSFSSLLVKDPLGNSAVVLSGGTDSGLSVGLRFATEASGAIISAEAITTAPANNTILIVVQVIHLFWVSILGQSL